MRGFCSIPEHIETSFSALECVQRCPVEYWISRYWRLPEPFGDTSKSGEFDYGRLTGEIFHNLAADYYTSKMHGYSFQAEDRIRTLLEADHVHPPRSVYDKIHVLWTSFLNSEWATKTPAPWDVERPVRWTLRLDKVLVTVRGRVDLIDRNAAGDPAIKDFKTKVSITDEDMDLYAVQGLLYLRSLGLQEDSIPVPPAVIHVTRDGIKDISLGDRMNHAAAILSKRFKTLVDVESATEVPARPSNVSCEQCGYASICPRTTITDHGIRKENSDVE